MQARVYLNTTTRQITRKLDASPFTWPTIPQTEDLILKFQLAEANEGFTELSDLEVKSASARLGKSGTQADFGNYKLVIDPPEAEGNVTVAIPYGATGTVLQDAINGLTDPALADLLPCTVNEANNVYRLQFQDKTATPTIKVADNSLWPVSFVSVDQQEWDEGNLYIISHRKTSGAITSTLGTRAPDLPVISQQQAGQSEDGLLLNEIQKLVIPSSYAGGAFQISREGRKSSIIPLPTSVDDLAEAIASTADEDGSYIVRASSQAFYIEFTGSMGFQPQPLLSIVPFDPPRNDHYLKLSTDTAEMDALMRTAPADGKLEIPLHITLETVNEIEPLDLDRFIWDVVITFTVPPDDGGNNAAQEIVWNQPRSRVAVLPHSPDSVLVGHRSYRQVIGDGVTVEFPISHDLGNNPKDVTVDTAENTFTAEDHNFHNLDPITIDSDDEWPAPLVEGQTVWVRDRTNDTFKVSERANGEVIDLTTAGSGNITAKMNDGSSDGFHVTVFEREGNRARLPENSYTAELTNDGTLTVKDFPAIPTNKQYVVHVTTVGRPATYQELELPIPRVIGLDARLAAIENRVSDLEDVAPAVFRRSDNSSLSGETWPVNEYAEIFPQQGRGSFEFPVGTAIAAFDQSGLPRVAPPLYPATHVTQVSAIPTVEQGGLLFPRAATESDKGLVFENTAAEVVNLSIGTGWEVQPGEYISSDGLGWFPVEQYGENPGNSYFPANMVRTLWEDTIEAEQLLPGREFGVRIATEIAALKANSPVYCHFVFETADLTEDAGETLGNLKADAWSPVFRLNQRVTLTSSPRKYVFGYKVTNDKNGDLSGSQLRFGEWAASTAPASNRFGIRLRLIQWDTVNAVEFPEGFIIYRGPTVDGIGGAAENSEDGFAYVKK